MSQYEVWCHACNVTFPPGTKKCLHCGARTQPDEPRALLRRAVGSTRFGDRAQSELVLGVPPSHPSMGLEIPAQEFRAELQEGVVPVEPEEEPVRRSLLRAGMTVVWMILLAAGYAWRACSSSPE